MDKFIELKAAAMAATPGPWVVTEKNNVEAPNQKRFRPVAYIFGNRAEHKRAADAAFIAAANPAVVLALLAELEDERASREQWQQNCTRAEERISELEAKLATPVRLQSPWVDKVGNRWLLEGTTADVIRAAGFAVTVEGDE
ncbi:TPA: ead/Ea22-like family protein [Serratia marcescens]|nr:ead/Ea22-like family protein [Serratia marcescens]